MPSLFFGKSWCDYVNFPTVICSPSTLFFCLRGTTSETLNPGPSFTFFAFVVTFTFLLLLLLCYYFVVLVIGEVFKATPVNTPLLLISCLVLFQVWLN